MLSSILDAIFGWAIITASAWDKCNNDLQYHAGSAHYLLFVNIVVLRLAEHILKLIKPSIIIYSIKHSFVSLNPEECVCTLCVKSDLKFSRETYP